MDICLHVEKNTKQYSTYIHWDLDGYIYIDGQIGRET